MKQYRDSTLLDMVFIIAITVISMISVRTFLLHNHVSQENTPIFTSQELQLSTSPKE